MAVCVVASTAMGHLFHSADRRTRLAVSNGICEIMDTETWNVLETVAVSKKVFGAVISNNRELIALLMESALPNLYLYKNQGNGVWQPKPWKENLHPAPDAMVWEEEKTRSTPERLQLFFPDGRAEFVPVPEN